MLLEMETELHRMEQISVIKKVEQPTEWCSPMVIVPKSNGKVRICGDFIQSNKAVRRENHPMPTTEQTLAKLAGVKIDEIGRKFGFLAAETQQKLEVVHHVY